MRSRGWIAGLSSAALASLALAQTTAVDTPRAPNAETLALPSAPIPYTQLHHPRARPPTAASARPRRTVTGAASAQSPPPVPVLSQGATAEPIPTAELEAFVDGDVRRGLDESHAPGAVVTVVQNGRIVLEKGYGLAGVSPLRKVDPRSTLFRLGAISRVLTAVEVMKAVREGRLHLGGAINDMLPAPLRIPGEGFGGPVRLEHLLAQTAGLESRDLGHAFSRSPRASEGLAATLARWRPRRVREAGEVYAYSNYAAALAGEAAAYVRRLDFEDLVERDLLRPAEMTSTTFREPHPARDDQPAPMSIDLAARLAQGFRWDDRGLSQTPFAWAEGLAPALSASSTGADMAILMRTLLAGGVSPAGVRVWDSTTQDLLAREMVASAPDRGSSPQRLMPQTLPGGAPALAQVGAVPGFRAKLTIAPSLSLGVFVATNGEGAERLTSGLADDIVSRFLARGVRAAPSVGADLEGVSGVYLTTRRAYHGLEGFVDRLTELSSVTAGDGRIAVTRHGRTQAYYPVGARRFADRDGVVRLAFLGALAHSASAFAAPAGEGVAERIDGLHRPVVLATLAALAGLTALLSLAGPFYRPRNDAARDTPAQVFSNRTQTLAAVVLLASLAAFLIFIARAREGGDLALRWPDVWLVTASWASIAFGLLTIVQIGLLGRVWRGARRLPGWSADRRLRHTMSVTIFGLYAFVLAAWGAMEPWAV